jgi:hypothetical protein
MADNVEEFILKYNVDVAETLRRLDALNSKLDKTGQKAKQSVGGLGTEIKTVAKEFVAAGAAIYGAWMTISKGIRIATEAMKDYNEQYLLSRRSGVGTLALEGVSQNMSRASGGFVGRAASRQALEAISSVVNQAYTDPTRMNMQNVKLRMMGISPTGKNGLVANSGEVMDQLSKRWSTMTKEMAQAEGELLGLTPQATDAMRALAGSVTDTTNVTLVAAKRQQEAAEAAKKLNDATEGFSTDIQTITKVITDELMKPLADAAKKLQGSSHSFATKLNDEGSKGFTQHAGRYFQEVWKRIKAGEGLPTDLKDQEALWDKTKEQKSEAQVKEEANQVKQITDEQRKAADIQHEAAQKQQLTANQFAMAVAAMPGSISMQQAIAAWAGEAAKGATSGGAGSPSGTLSSGGAAGKGGGAGGHGPVVEALMSHGWTQEQAIGIAANLKHESNFDPTAVGDSGKAYGIAQWHPDRQAKFKELYGKDIRGSTMQEQVAFVNWELRNTEKGAGDRLANARGAGEAASIVSQYYERPADRMGEAARRAATAQGMAPTPRGRFGLSEAQRWQTGASIANQIHMSPEQFMRETASGKGVTSGDVQYGIDAQRKGMINNIYRLENEIKAYEAAGKPQMMHQKEQELFAMKQQMRGFEQYAGGFLDTAKVGGAQRTEGMPPIQIIVNGTTDPRSVAEHVKQVLGQEMHKVVNDTSRKHVS